MEGIEVVMIDNSSDDGCRDLYKAHAGNPIIAVEEVPWRGFFSLSELLEVQHRIRTELKHDWFIHFDADEILEHREAGRTLRDAITEAEEAGCNCINLEEFVFLPSPGEDFLGRDYYAESLRYYHFAPGKNRQNRIWKRSANLDNRNSAGHVLAGENVALFPVNHVKRHYIALSQEQIWSKYLTRTFDPAETAWHTNRRNFTRENLLLPHDAPGLFRVSNAARDFRWDAPVTKHYWEWEKSKK